MNWPNSTAMYGYGKQPDEDDVNDDGEEEDFYGYESNGNTSSTNANHAMAGAASNGTASGTVRLSPSKARRSADFAAFSRT